MTTATRQRLGPRRWRTLLTMVIGGLACLANASAAPPTPLRPATLDADQAERLTGWTRIDRSLFDAYAKSLVKGENNQTAGGIERCEYRLKLHADGSLSGEAAGRMNLVDGAADLAIGQPSFAMTELLVDHKPVQWGTDPSGVTYVRCPRDEAEFGFRLSQRGVRRGESLEFPINWLTSIASRVELTVPAGQIVESSGLLKTSEVAGPEGTRTISFEAGARSASVLRCRPEEHHAKQPFGVELRETVSASPTKVVIQSVIRLLSQSTGPASVDIDVPPGFTLVKATLAESERLSVSLGSDGAFRAPLGEVAVGQRLELRLVMERAADWNKPLSVPRLVVRDCELLREEWVLQIEKPLELSDVDAPSFVQSGLTDDAAREIWTYRGNDRSGLMTITARVPAPEWSADCYFRGRQQGSRSEVLVLIDLKSARGPLYEFDIDVLKPWKVVSATTRDAAGVQSPLSFQAVRETESTVRSRIILRNALPSAGGMPITLTVATQVQPGAAESLAAIATPHGGNVQNFLVQTADSSPHQPDRDRESAIPANTLRAALRGSAFFENLKLDTISISRVAGGSPNGSPANSHLTAAIADRNSAAQPAQKSTGVAPGETAGVCELQTTLGTGAEPAVHRARFIVDRPVDMSGAVIRVGGEWTLISARCDGRLVRALPLPGEVLFPKQSAAVREIELTWSSPTPADGVQRRETVQWPQFGLPLLRWTWKIESPAERRVTSINGPFEVAGGLSRPSLRERLFAPLGRAANLTLFNPFSVIAWRQFLWKPANEPSSVTKAALIVAAGRDYPTSTSIVSWSHQLLQWLDWVILLGTMLVISFARMVTRRTFRLGTGLAAIAATGAWLMSPPFASMAGAVFCGTVFAVVVPRRLLLPARTLQTHPRSSVFRLAGASVVLLPLLVALIRQVSAESQSGEPNVLLSADGQAAYVEEVVAKEIADWQTRRAGPAYLIRGANYEVAIDDSDIGSARLRFDLLIPDPAATRSVQLPFEGITLKGPDAAKINGFPARLIPAADGAGVILPVPPQTERGEPAELQLELDATLRVARANSRRELAITMPKCVAATARIDVTSGAIADFRSTSRGSSDAGSSSVSSRLGAVSRWRARWGSEVPAQPVNESIVTAAAQSVVLAESESLRIHTRLTIESPELADPFGALRLAVRLPAGAIVAGVTGDNVLHWRPHSGQDGMTVLLDLAGPAIVGQQFDFEYDLPIDLSSPITIPPMPFLAPPVSGHQIAIITPSTFRSEILTKPDPAAGVWAIEPSAASLSLRKDRGDPLPSAAIELERPRPLQVSFSRRPTGRGVELEQSLIPVADAIAWTGSARIENTIRPGFLYEFRVDPAIEIQSSIVTERDIDRPSRFLREGERLLLIVKDDRLGTKNVRLEGKLKLEAGKVRKIPLFELQDAAVSRREIIITSSLDQLLQIRRGEASLIVPGRADSEWEPTTPSSRRIALPAERSPYVLRWINPASPLNVIEFLRLPQTDEGSTAIEWRIDSAQTLPATLAIIAPAETHLVEGSDFTEETRHPAANNRQRIELQSKVARAASARLRMTIPAADAMAGATALPILADLSVQPVTYLAVPTKQLPRFRIPGDFLDQLPAAAPAEWSSSFADRSLLVFRLAEETWTMAKEADASLGHATAEILTWSSGPESRGQTRWVINPARVGLLRIEPPERGKLNAVACTPNGHVSRGEAGTWELLLRPSQPVALLADWTGPGDRSGGTEQQGPRVPGLLVDVAYSSRVLPKDESKWAPEILSRPAGMDLLASIRLTNLLQAARTLPIGARPPGWLRDELLDLAHEFRTSPQLGHLAVEVESVLDSWSRIGKSTALNSVAPDGALVTHNVERMLADSMFVAAADPENDIAVPTGHSAWSISRRIFHGAFATAWFIFWAFLITKGGQWARQHEVADRIAQRPALAVFAIGIGWWLLLSPGALGVVIAGAAGLFEAASLVRQRRLRIPAQSGSASR